jgi:RHS repeat-associated protein
MRVLPDIGRRRRFAACAAALTAAALMVNSGVGDAFAGPSSAQQPRLWRPRPLPAQAASVPLKVVVGAPRTGSPTPAKGFSPAKPSWPAAAGADVTLAGATGAKPAHAAAGIPLLVAPAGALSAGLLPPTADTRAAQALNQKAATPASVHVTVVDHTAAQRAGVSGLLVSVARPTPAIGTAAAATDQRVSVGLDYTSIKDAFGGGYGDRLRLAAYPACALTTPQVAACQTATPVAASANDLADNRLVADVSLPADGSVLLGTTSDASGTSGSYAASPLTSTAQWAVSGNTGAFTYTYPITTPPAPGGNQPKLSLAYSSQEVDGRTSQTNGQGSWAGDGWTLWPGQITRTYRTCSDDGQPTGVVDQCWAGDNATLMLNGASHQLVLDDKTGTWHLAEDDGSQVFELSGNDFGISNGLYNNTFWALRDRTGTVYVFGADHLPGTDKTPNRLGTLGGSTGIGSDANTNSAWGVQVYGNNPGEPCNSSAGYNSSSCFQGWQWNLDFVVSPRADITVYKYGTETNYYAAGTNHTLTTQPYVRGGYLTSVSYGWKTSDYQAKAHPADTVSFGMDSAGRCSTANNFTCKGATIGSPSTNTGAWPDVPWDLNCGSTGTCANHGPSFWTNDRLTSITTQVWDTSLSTPGYRTVDSYQLASNDFPDPADGTTGVNNSASPKAMWLDSVTHTGADTGGGGAAVLDNPVYFNGAFYPNRVPGLIQPAVTPMNRMRINKITAQTGAVITVAYSSDTCSRTSPPAEDHDTMSCYPVKWTPPSYTSPILDWFTKYLASEVDVADNTTTSSPAQVTKYEYLPNGAAWHHEDDQIVAPKFRTWGEFRGYKQVITRTGAAPDPITKSVTQYLQGMDGDLNLDGSHKSVSVTDDLGDTVTDQDPLSGNVYETSTYDKDGGSAQVHAATVPWLSPATADHVQTTGTDTLPDLKAYYGGDAATYTDQLVDPQATPATWRMSGTVTTNDNATGLVDAVDDLGEIDPGSRQPVPGSTTPEKCTRTTYAANSGNTISGLTAEVVAVAGPCSTAADATHALSDQKTFYDGSTTLGTIPSGGTGEATSTTQLKDWNGTGGAAEWTKPTTVSYDAYDRVTSSTDAMGRTTGTAYNPAGSKFLPTSIVTTNNVGWTSKQTLDVARALALSSSDVNGQTTTKTYDGLGRLTAVWLPTHPQSANATTPNDRFTYTVSATGPSMVDSETLRDNLTYHEDYKIYDSLQQVREEQTTPPDASAGARLVQDTIYDSHGKAVFSDTPYWNSQSAPNSVYATPATSAIPAETKTVYDGMGRTVSTTDAYNGVDQWSTTYAYPSGDEVDTTPPAGGTATAVITDARGDKAQVRQFHGSTPSGTYDTTNYFYDAAGRPTGMADSAGDTWKSSYDDLGDKVAVSDPDTGLTTTSFNDAKQTVQTSDNRPNNAGTVTNSYDTLGRVTDTWGVNPATQAQVHLTHTDYDPAGALGHVAQTTSYDANGNAWTSKVTGYTADYLPTSSTLTAPAAALKAAADVSYNTTTTYKPISRQVNNTSLPAIGTMPSETVSYAYNDNGLPVSSGGASTYVYWIDYTHLGAVLDATMGDFGTQVVQTYNYALGTARMLGYTVDAQASGPGNTSQTLDDVSYTFDDSGQKTSSTDVQTGADTPAGTDTQCYQYDYLGRLVEAWSDTAGVSTQAAPKINGDGGCTTTQPGTSTLGGTSPYWQSYGYDALGNRTALTDHSVLGAGNDVKTTSTFNAVAPAGTAGSAVTMPHGLATTSSVNGGGAQTVSYDAAGETTEIKAADGSKTLAGGATLASGAQLVTSTTRLAMEQGGNLALYTRSTGALLWSSNTAGHPGATAVMGADGNLAVKDTSGTTLWSSNTPGTGATAKVQDDGRLVVYNTSGTPVWSSAANPVAGAADDMQLTYDHNGRLATTTQGSLTSNYTYDQAGTLLARTDNGATTLYLGSDQISVDGTGAVTGDVRDYGLKGAPGATRVATAGSTTSTLHYQVADPQGSAGVDITSDDKTTLRRMYTPYGTDRTPGGLPQGWGGSAGYLGGAQDNQTGLTNEGAREYSPALGRFLSRDSVVDTSSNPQTWNGYSYSGDDPVDFADPSGNGRCAPGFDGFCGPTGGNGGNDGNPIVTGPCGGGGCGGSYGGGSGGGCDANCQAINQYFGATPPGAARIFFYVPVGQDHGIIVLRTFIPWKLAAFGGLLGDDRGFSLDPNASYRVAVAWNTASGLVSFTVSPSHSAPKDGHWNSLGRGPLFWVPGEPSRMLPARPIGLGNANVISYLGQPGTPGDGILIHVGGLNSLVGCCEVSYNVGVSFTGNDTYGRDTYVHLEGTRYPDFEAIQYQHGQPPADIGRQSSGHFIGDPGLWSLPGIRYMNGFPPIPFPVHWGTVTNQSWDNGVPVSYTGSTGMP